MLDIETLGPGPGSIITSIALVPFNLNGKEVTVGIKEPLLVNLNVGEQIAKGYTMDPETIKWWMQNDPKVREETLSGIVMLKPALEKLATYVKTIEHWHATYRLWATSAKMDYGCISYTTRNEGLPYPFDHRAEHCARTVRNLTKMLVPTYKVDADKGRNHNALQDCNIQISHLQEQYQELRKLSGYGIEVNKLIAENTIVPGD